MKSSIHNASFYSRDEPTESIELVNRIRDKISVFSCIYSLTICRVNVVIVMLRTRR